VIFPYGGELLGDGNAPLYGLLDTQETLQQGISASVKNGTSIKGVLKFSSLINPAQVKAEKDKFIADYFNPGNNAGLAAVDQRYDFVPTNITPYSIPQDTLNAVAAQVFAYIGISPRIVTGGYTENQFSAFYESCIEPFAMQMSLEFSRKCGVEIRVRAVRVFSGDQNIITPRSRAAQTFNLERSAATKIKLLHEAAPPRLLTLNEARKLLSLPEVEDRDKPIST
jgi:hypothetical protein